MPFTAQVIQDASPHWLDVFPSQVRPAEVGSVAGSKNEREKHAIKINMSYIYIFIYLYIYIYLFIYILTNKSYRILHIAYNSIYIYRACINLQCMHHKWWNCAGFSLRRPEVLLPHWPLIGLLLKPQHENHAISLDLLHTVSISIYLEPK